MRTSRAEAGRGSGERPGIVHVLRWWFRVPVRRRERSWAPAAISLLGLAAAILAARVAQVPSGRPPAEPPLVIATGDASMDALPLPSDLPAGMPTSTVESPLPTTSGPTASLTASPAVTRTTSAPATSTVRPSPSPSRDTRPSPSTTAVPTCRASHTFSSNWGSGFVVSITITNTSGRAWSGWSGGFGMSTAATVTSSWGATLLASGGWVTLVPADYNASLPPGGSAQLGFQAATSSPVTQLGRFSVNGNPCSPG